jgi:hypothetical protein
VPRRGARSPPSAYYSAPKVPPFAGEDSLLDSGRYPRRVRINAHANSVLLASAVAAGCDSCYEQILTIRDESWAARITVTCILGRCAVKKLAVVDSGERKIDLTLDPEACEFAGDDVVAISYEC